MAFTRISRPTGIRTLGDPPSDLTKRLIADGLKPRPSAHKPILSALAFTFAIGIAVAAVVVLAWMTVNGVLV